MKRFLFKRFTIRAIGSILVFFGVSIIFYLVEFRNIDGFEWQNEIIRASIIGFIFSICMWFVLWGKQEKDKFDPTI